MGLNLGFLGKKIGDIVNAGEHDVGNAAQGVAHGVGAFPGFANNVGSAIGNAVLHAPVINQAVQFGQQSATPQFNQQPFINQLGQFGRGIFETGYQNSPVGLAQQGGGDIAATVTGKPQVSFLEQHQPVQNAAPVLGHKSLGVALAAANIPLELAGAVGGVKLPVDRVPAPSVALKNAADSLQNQSGHIAITAPRLNKPVNPALPDPVKVAINEAQNAVEDMHTQIAMHQDSINYAKEHIDSLPGVKPQVKDKMKTDFVNEVNAKVAAAKQEQAGWLDHIQKLDPSGLSTPTKIESQVGKGVPAGTVMPYHPQPTKLDKIKATVKQVLGNEGGSINPEAELGKPKVALKQDEAAKFFGIDPNAPSTAEAANATREPLTVEKVAKASANAKQIEDQATQTAIDRSASAANNPVKIELSKVKEGDHGQAIANSQQVSRPVDTAATLWQNAMKRLNPDETKNFWKSVEEPTAPHSPALQKAIDAWRAGADQAHAGATALDKGVGYMQNYARHPWDLSGWKEAEGQGAGVFTKAERKHMTIAEGEASGLKQKGDPLAEGQAYFKAASSQLRKDALIKGLTEADAGEATKAHTLDLGYGKTVPLSDKGMKAVRGLHPDIPSSNIAIKGARAVNKAAKSSLLSASQFHTANIGLLRAFPTLIARGHFVEAAKGLYGMVRGAFGSEYADRVIGNALKDGTVEKAAKIGMPYGSSAYEGILKGGIGEHTVFDKQMPMMHNQVVRSILSDLDKRGIALDTPQAREAGKAGNMLMGFINHEAQNVSPKIKRAMGDFFLAGQFTPSKAGLVKMAVSKGGVGGGYARAAVVGNTAAALGVIAGLGYVAQQKSDNIKDMLLRALVDPAVPTNSTDSKGNTVKLRLPGTDTSDIAKLLGMTLVRGQDGHLGINWSPQNMPTTIADFLKARLSPLASAGVKIGTNSNFAGKPLYDPNASAGTKAQQAATSLGIGQLPIGAQGLAYTDGFKNAAPPAIKQVLNAQTPGANPVLKSIGSSFGLTPSTDTTVGKGQQTAQYFNELNKAKQGLNRQAQDAVDLYTGSKKNPVTGAYDVTPNVNDQRAKATTLLQNSSALDHLVTMNKNLANAGQKVDPLWGASKEQITSYLQYQAMRPDGPDQKNWRLNNPWYQPLQQSRSAFFASLPPGDPNKPPAPIEYPQASPAVQALQSQFFALPDAKSKALFINGHPDLQAQFDAQFKYYNDLSSAQGYTPVKGHPVASPELEAKINAKDWKDPEVQQYLNQTSEYNIIQGGANAQFQGTDLSQSALKGIESLGQYGIVQNPNGQLAIAGSAQAQPGAKSQAYSAKYPRRPHIRRPFVRKMHSEGLGSSSGKAFKVSFKGSSGKRSSGMGKIASATTYTGGKPKVSIRKSTA